MRSTAVTQSHLPGQPEASWPFPRVSTPVLLSVSTGTSGFVAAIVCSLGLCLCPVLLLLSVSGLGSSGLDGFSYCTFCLSLPLTVFVFFLVVVPVSRLVL